MPRGPDPEVSPTQQPRFGLFIGQAGRTWHEQVEGFQLAEELGFDHAWLVDHLLDTDGSPDVPMHEAWTLLAGLAAVTSRIRLGVLVTSNTFRQPALLAKQAVTVDHISRGRLILGLGTGWYEDEHRRYGLPFPSAGERVDRLEETIEVLESLMQRDRTTFHGRHYRLEDAPLSPKPLQRPRIPLLIGAHRPRMLQVAARHADMWDTFPTIPGSATAGMQEEVAARVERFEAACREIGRDPREIRRSTWAAGDVSRSEEAFLTFVRNYRSLGFTDFTTGLPGPAGLPALRRIAGQTIPALRAGKAL